MEREINYCLPFLDVLVTSNHGNIETAAFQKLIHTEQYLNRTLHHQGTDRNPAPLNCHHLQHTGTSTARNFQHTERPKQDKVTEKVIKQYQTKGPT